MASTRPPDPTETTPVAPTQQVAGGGSVQAPTPVELDWPLPAIRGVPEAILHAVIYADLFDYPLRCEEIHRFLPGHRAPLAVVQEQVTSHPQLSERLSSVPPYWFLAGRDHLVSLRRQREAFSRELWPLAWRYGRWMAAMPFVRLVAITGSLTMNNVTSARDDVDFLIVTQTGRVWLARGLVIMVVHLAERAGLELCPNYVIAEHSLQIGKPSLFTAHELAQLVPLFGASVYQQLMESNRWMAQFLPNASPQPGCAREIGRKTLGGQRLLEAFLAGRLGHALERWERERKIPRLRRTAHQRGSTNAMYTPDLCKGHVNDHATGIRQRYAARLAAQGF